MNSMLGSVAKDISLKLNQEIKTVDKVENGWALFSENQKQLLAKKIT